MNVHLFKAVCPLGVALVDLLNWAINSKIFKLNKFRLGQDIEDIEISRW